MYIIIRASITDSNITADMKYGFVKVASASPASSVADSNANAQRIIEQVTEATSNEVELILFPELCLTSRSCGDLFTQPHFIQSCNNAITRIARETIDSNTIIVFGAPVEHRNALYNCAVVMHKGEIIGIVPKRYLNTQTGESRWFASADNLPSDSHTTINGNKAPFIKELEADGKKIAIAILYIDNKPGSTDYLKHKMQKLLNNILEKVQKV